jgi:hypothetical protein
MNFSQKHTPIESRSWGEDRDANGSRLILSVVVHRDGQEIAKDGCPGLAARNT